jgi:uncharacterized Fe-S cluster-containing MiaB family protein
MSRHALPATHRCAWCSRLFDSAPDRKSHEHLIHRANLVLSQEAEAAARMQHYHADRMAVLRGRAP